MSIAAQAMCLYSQSTPGPQPLLQGIPSICKVYLTAYIKMPNVSVSGKENQIQLAVEPGTL